MSPTPLYRDPTVAERRAQQLEAATLVAVAAVFAAAAAASFFALYWVGRGALGWPAPIAALFPLAVDGIAVVAAVATVLFAGHRGLRAFAWVVFMGLLIVSLAGNVAHAFTMGHPELLPGWLFAAFAAAPPVIVALGVHLYALIARHGVGDRVAATNRAQVLVDPEAFTAAPAPRRPPTAAAPPTPRSNPDPVPVAPREDAVPAGERAAYAAYAAEWEQAGQEPSGARVAQLLHAHGARAALLSDAQGRKVRDRWRSHAPDGSRAVHAVGAA